MTSRPDALRHLADELRELERMGLLRARRPVVERPTASVNLCSNDYLGYVRTGALRELAKRASEEIATGATASRLVCGDADAHRRLERSVAQWFGTHESLVFTSGYAANVGAMAALAQAGDLVVSDALNHASLIDGCRLSRARVMTVPHGDVGAVRTLLRREGGAARRRWVVTESLFSMDGDRPDLVALREACDENDAALVVDEAHAVGVLGPGGRGACAEVGVVPDVLVGTFGKALGAQGAFVAGSRELVAWLWNRARSFIFSTGLSPLLAAVAEGAVRLARADDAGRARLRHVQTELRSGLEALGLLPKAGRAEGPIFPVVLGDEVRALGFAERLRGRGVEVQAIRPPSVPRGTSRLRVTAHASLGEDDLSFALAAFREVRDGFG